MILPGKTLGLLGGGQLGRMFTVAARTMGYHVIVLDPDPESPAGELATDHLCAEYQDPRALEYLTQRCAAITTEFENVPAAALGLLALSCVMRPGAKAVSITQDRIREKNFLQESGFPVAQFAAVRNTAELEAALARIGLPALLKVSRLGYDGKGQARVSERAGARAAWDLMGHQPCVLEELLDLKAEVSVVLARGADGAMATFPVAENVHHQGILDMSMAPARVSAAVQREAVVLAQAIAERLEYVGVLAVEFFVLAGERLTVNEIAPRPHNSGHYTLDACVTSQFEQQVRALCGLPLGPTRLHAAAVMVNLLGDLWPATGGEPDWGAALHDPCVKLHLYGKRNPRPGRKMGHYTCLGETLDQALAAAMSVRGILRSQTSRATTDERPSS